MTLVETTSRDITQHVPIDQAAILRAFKIDVNDPKAQAMILACQKYGLDPLLKHAVLISGNLYITRDGLLAIAHRSGQLDGIVIEDEGDDAREWWAKVTVHVKGQTHGYTYKGRYPKDGQQKKYGPEMAVKCAEVMALRRAFGVTGLSTVEEQWDIAPLVLPEQMERIEELLPLVPDEAKAALSEWKDAEQISMRSGEFTADMADRVIAKLEELADPSQIEAGQSGTGAPPVPNDDGKRSAAPAVATDEVAAPVARPEHAGTTEVVPQQIELGGEGFPDGESAGDGTTVPPSPPTPSGPVTLGDLLNRMEGKAAATRKGRLLKVATEVAKEHSWPAPETVDKIDQRLLEAIAAGMPDADPRANQRRWMHAVWGLNGGNEARKDAISVLTSGRTDSSNDLTDDEFREFMDVTGALPVQLPPREGAA